MEPNYAAITFFVNAVNDAYRHGEWLKEAENGLFGPEPQAKANRLHELRDWQTKVALGVA